MISIVYFFIDRCCGRRHAPPQACDLEFRVDSTTRTRLSTIERNNQRPIKELKKLFEDWKELKGDKRINQVRKKLFEAEKLLDLSGTLSGKVAEHALTDSDNLLELDGDIKKECNQRPMTESEELLEWLDTGLGHKYISSYKRFRELAAALSIPSCERDFRQTYHAIKKEEGGEEYELQRQAERKADLQLFSTVGSI